MSPSWNEVTAGTPFLSASLLLPFNSLPCCVMPLSHEMPGGLLAPCHV